MLITGDHATNCLNASDGFLDCIALDMALPQSMGLTTPSAGFTMPWVTEP